MNLEVSIKDISPDNKRDKLLALTRVLSEQMGLGAHIHLQKAFDESKHPRGDDGQFALALDTGGIGGGAPTSSAAAEPPIIEGIAPIAVNANNWGTIQKREFKKLEARIQKKDLFCAVLGNRRIAGIRRKHLKETKGKARTESEIIKRIALMPYIIPIIEKGAHTETRNGEKGASYKITGRIKNGPDERNVSVILIEDKKTNLLYFSVFDDTTNVSKSLTQMGGSFPSCRSIGFPSRLGREQRLASLNHNLIIPDISAMSIENFPDIELSIHGVTRANRRAKFAKAIKAVSKRLGVPVDIERKGEDYFYALKQELSDRWAAHYKAILGNIYAVVTSALGLPVMEVETMRKAIDERVLKYRGKIIYAPETGRPIKKKDFDALIKAIENFLNRNTRDTGKRIVLDAVAVGKLLKRMAKYQTAQGMEALKLDTMKYRGKTFDWIRDDMKNIQEAFRLDGRDMSRNEIARYQVAQDWVAQKVTRVNNAVKDEIKDTILNGIVEKRSRSQVSQDLFNRLGGLNRDWKRIADTEIVNTSNLASILEDVRQTPEGEKVYFRRVELPNCCEKCEKINGMIALWSDAPLDDDKIKDPYAKVAIWEGKAQDKNSIGTGTVHPNCRGEWVRWGGKEVDAMTAKINNKIKIWDESVTLAREEFKAQGVDNPNDQTKGYTDRINELYREKLGE